METLEKENVESKRKKRTAPRLTLLFVLALALPAAILLALAACHGGTQTSTEGQPTENRQTTPGGSPDEKVPVAGGLISVTEIQIKNEFTYADEKGAYTPWVEIRNHSASEAELSEYAIELDGKGAPLPAGKLNAGEYRVFFFDTLGLTPGQTGTLKLTHKGRETQSVSYENKNVGFSYSVIEKAEKKTPTPGGAKTAYPDLLMISEIMAKNKSYPVDGVLGDWFEVYNPGPDTLELSDYFASDKAESPYAMRLPAGRIAPQEYRVFACREDLSLSDGGDSLFITRKDGVCCADLTFGEVGEDRTVLGDRKISEYPTPGKANTAENRYTLYSGGGLVINEVLSSNTKYAKAENGVYYDIVELYNDGAEELHLSDFCLSDKKKNLQLWRLPDETLAPGGFFTVYAAGKEISYVKHTAPFKISSEGDTLYLSRYSETGKGEVIDALRVPKVPVDRSYGRYEGQRVYFATPTVGAANGFGYTEMSQPVTASVAPGCYDHFVSVRLSTSDGGRIHYTTDGSKPTQSSPVYGGGDLQITKTGSVRAVCYTGDRIPSEVATFNYFISEPEYSLDMISLTLKPSDFSTMYENFLRNHEYEANFSYFEDGKERFSVNCGIKISGKSSRYFAKKSFVLHFRSKYGCSTLHDKVFDNLDIDEFNSLVIRSGSAGAANFRAFYNDELVTSIVTHSENMDLISQSYKPVNVYVNGEYYGIYFIREKVSDAFIASHTGVSRESVSVMYKMTELIHGTSDQGMKDLWAFIKNNDLTKKENYEYIKKNISLESVADYYILQVWCVGSDSANVRLYRSTEGDGLWRYTPFDFDFAFGGFRKAYGAGAAKAILGTYNTKESTYSSYNALIYKLLRNAEFKELFFKRLKLLVETDLSVENTNALNDEIYNLLYPDMHYTIDRWKNAPYQEMNYHKSMAEWQTNVDQVKKYYLSQERLDAMISEFISLVGLSADQVRAYMGEAYLKYV